MDKSHLEFLVHGKSDVHSSMGTTGTLSVTNESVDHTGLVETSLTDELEEKTDICGNKTNQQFTRDFTPTDSNSEWAAIAKEIKNQLKDGERKKTTVTPLSQQSEKLNATVRFSKRNKVIPIEFPTDKASGNMKERGVNTHSKLTKSWKSVNSTNTKKSNIVVVTMTNPKKANIEIMENRGGFMTEDRETLITPMKIEFDLANTMEEFNIIVAVSTLFTKLNSVDKPLKVYNNNRTELIWEDSKILSEDEKFVQQFHMREQMFQNGNKKVTLHCTLESFHNLTGSSLWSR